MKPCSICGKDTDREPLDSKKPIVCYDCKYVCRECGAKLVRDGGHGRLCDACETVMKPFKSKKITGPLGIILKI